MARMFLAAWLRARTGRWTLENGETGLRLASQVHGAVDSASRRRGLLGKAGLDDEALVIAPCAAIHTCFMRFPIDVLFTDRAGRVLRARAHLVPWRAAGAWRAFAAIELPAGTIEQTGTVAGQHLRLVRHPDAAAAP